MSSRRESKAEGRDQQQRSGPVTGILSDPTSVGDRVDHEERDLPAGVERAPRLRAEAACCGIVRRRSHGHDEDEAEGAAEKGTIDLEGGRLEARKDHDRDTVNDLGRGKGETQGAPPCEEGPRNRAGPEPLEHDPQKWIPVLRQRSCSNKRIEPHSDSFGMEKALVRLAQECLHRNASSPPNLAQAP